jgi:hypothetical protein
VKGYREEKGRFYCEEERIKQFLVMKKGGIMDFNVI